MGRQALGRALGARSDFRRASMGTIGICHQHVEQNGTFVDHPPGSSYLGRDDPRVVFAVALLDGRAGHVAPDYRFDSRFFSRRGEGSGTPEHGRGDGGLKRRSTRAKVLPCAGCYRTANSMRRTSRRRGCRDQLGVATGTAARRLPISPDLYTTLQRYVTLTIVTFAASHAASSASSTPSVTR